ncbi:cupin domain-containing protein [Chitinophaga sp. sic0106]|uniref:cupin domain-containing protein n=1 Tax=Chitinophaga sp. sic0106 TaxID=2854785 RepID=UPI001C494883|nr:cupin domain-containing protein [Chitinophaga sp. sic0106]MBV7532611.1 cupin domain-containing protein [Chitinophaga sp. sic0106]
MATTTLSFKYALEKATPKIAPGGITRGASVREFPASQNLAGVSMHLDPGAMRELHWHANAAEWAYVLKGRMRTTTIDPQGNTYIDLFGPGDVWYFPRGFGHVLQCISNEPCHFILIFDNGDFSEDHTFSVTDFISSVPPEIAAQNLGLTLEEVVQLPQKEMYFAPSQLPDVHSGLAVPRDKVTLTSPHRYPLGAQMPKLVPGGGTQRVVTQQEFPIAKTITGSVFEIEPGGLRELHWHPNADEWQYYIQGTAEMGVFLAQGQFVKEQFEAGDVGYAPMGAGHYIKNTGSDLLIVLLGFNSGNYEAIDLSMWLSGNPKDILEGNFAVGPHIIDKFPADDKFIIK